MGMRRVPFQAASRPFMHPFGMGFGFLIPPGPAVPEALVHPAVNIHVIISEGCMKKTSLIAD